MFRKIIQPFYTAYVLVTFIIGLLLAFLFNLLFSLGSNIAARKRVNKNTRYFMRAWLWVIGIPVKVSGQRQYGKYVYIANHSSYVDDIILFPTIRSHFLVLGKKELAKAPVWGYLYKQMVILIDRKSPESRAMSMKLMAEVIEKEGGVLIFPEGTFNESQKPLKDFYDGAFRLAIITQAPIVPIIFPDAVSRAHYSAWWKFWPGRNRAIYLDPIPVTGLILDNVPMLKQQAYSLMENALVKYRTSFPGTPNNIQSLIS